MKLIIFPKDSTTVVFDEITEDHLREFKSWYNSFGSKMYDTKFKIHHSNGYTTYNRSEIVNYKESK